MCDADYSYLVVTQQSYLIGMFLNCKAVKNRKYIYHQLNILGLLEIVAYKQNIIIGLGMGVMENWHL